MTNQLHTVLYGGPCPSLRTSKFMSLYHICDPFEGNAYMIIHETELLVSSFRKFAVTLLKTWKLCKW